MAINTINRPRKYSDFDRQIHIVRDCETALRVEYDGSGNPIYIGRAKIGTPTSQSKWQIAFLTFDGSGNVTSKKWPEDSEGNSTSDYIFNWDNRATYTYA